MKINLTRPLVFVDLETTGMDYAKDRIVEIAAVKLLPDGNVIEKVHRLNPTIPIPAEVPCSTPFSKSICMPTQIPRVGFPFANLLLIISSPFTDKSPDIQDPNAPTPGTTNAWAFAAESGSEVKKTFLPVVSNARSADLKFPDP